MLPCIPRGGRSTSRGKVGSLDGFEQSVRCQRGRLLGSDPLMHLCKLDLRAAFEASDAVQYHFLRDWLLAVRDAHRRSLDDVESQ